MAVNSVMLTGNLVRDPEVRSTTSGFVVMTFSIAVNLSERNRETGEWEEVPSYFDCVMFGNRAEAVSRFVRKGSKVAVQGRLKQRRWETDDGQKRSKVEVTVDEIEFMSRQQRTEEPTYEEPGYSAPAPRQSNDYWADSDMPF